MVRTMYREIKQIVSSHIYFRKELVRLAGRALQTTAIKMIQPSLTRKLQKAPWTVCLRSLV